MSTLAEGIGFREFSIWWAVMRTEKAQEWAARTVFEVLDVAGIGHISNQQLNSAIRRLFPQSDMENAAIMVICRLLRDMDLMLFPICCEQ